jgi:branched-chain amino acid aminotransferase
MLWLNGRLVSPAAARIDPADRGFTLGDGLFETIRIAAGRSAHLRRHLHRLHAGLQVLRISVAYADDVMAQAFASLLEANKLDNGSARVTVTRGPATRGVAPPARPNPTVLIAAHPPGPVGSAVDAIVCTTTTRNQFSPLSRIKSLNYLDAILARAEAAQRGVGDALLLNTEGRLAEATAANVFALLDGRLVTPPVTDGALPGIARALLIERSSATEASLRTEHLFEADAVFLTNSLGLRPVATLDGRPLRRRDDLLADLEHRLAED